MVAPSGLNRSTVPDAYELTKGQVRATLLSLDGESHKAILAGIYKPAVGVPSLREGTR